MPATTSSNQPTDRQLRFYNALAAERGLPTIEAFDEHATRRDASQAIEHLIERVPVPRRAEATPASRPADDLLPTPSRGTRAGRMLNAGGIDATVTLPSGEHCTVQIRTRRPQGRGWTNAHPTEDGARTNISILGRRVGWLNVSADGRWALTLRTRRSDYRAAVEAIFQYAATGTSDLRVQEASRCGRCFRTLTDPVSIDRGIGPECFGRDTGSQHVAAEREASGDAVRREPLVQTGRLNPGEHSAVRNEQVREHNYEVMAREVESQQRAYEAAEAAMNRLVAEREREQETAAFLSDPDLQMERPATTTAVPTNSSDIQVARNLIAEALDCYLSDDRDGEATFALDIFDQLAARAS
jgi:hypothetical protein